MHPNHTHMYPYVPIYTHLNPYIPMYHSHDHIRAKNPVMQSEYRFRYWSLVAPDLHSNLAKYDQNKHEDGRNGSKLSRISELKRYTCLSWVPNLLNHIFPRVHPYYRLLILCTSRIIYGWTLCNRPHHGFTNYRVITFWHFNDSFITLLTNL